MTHYYISSVDYAALPTWQASHAYSLGAVIQPNTGKNFAGEYCFVITTAGTSGTTEPAWAQYNPQPSDGSAVWQQQAGVAAYNGDGGGSNWGAPLPTIQNNIGSAGDSVFLKSNHHETIGSGGQIDVRNAVAFLSVGSSPIPPTSLTAGAIVEQTAGDMQFGIYYTTSNGGYLNGITFLATGGSIILGNYPVNGGYLTFEGCTFQINNTTSGSAIKAGGNIKIRKKGCTFVFDATGQSLQYDGAETEIIGGTVAATGTVPTSLFTTRNNYQQFKLTVRGVDLSNINTTIFTGSQTCYGTVDFIGCKLNASATLFTQGSWLPQGLVVRFVNCDSANTNYRYARYSWGGVETSDTTHYRTGGAKDQGTTSIAWAIVTDGNPTPEWPHVVEDLFLENTFTTGSHTVTLYLASNTALNTDDVWAELDYPGTSSYPLSLTTTSFPGYPLSNASLTTDGSTWGGSPTYVYKIVLTYSPTEAGMMRVRTFVGKPSVTIYLDPAPVAA